MTFRPAQCLTAAAACGALLWSAASAGAAGGDPSASKPRPVSVPLEEARRMVRLMDDIYRTGVLTTHQMYIQEPGLPSAVAWGKQVLGQVNAKGWPQARIFAASERPLNPENSPVDNFEREAVQAFKEGKTSAERREPGVLRYASEIRVVDKSCLTCHVRNKVGDLLGGVSYRAMVTESQTARKR